jgi:hypothetical protein
MTILLVGAVYWVWTQIQYVQRKVNVLENIVYELKTLYSKHSELDGPVAPAKYPPAPTSVIGEEDEDLLRETLQSEEEEEIGMIDSTHSPVMKVEEIEFVEQAPDSPLKPFVDDVVEDVDISPDVENIVSDLPAFDSQESMTVGGGGDGSEAISGDLQPGGVGSGIIDYNNASAIEAMSLKELRRLAQSKGISGASDMKKKDLIIAIRSTPIESFLE